MYATECGFPHQPKSHDLMTGVDCIIIAMDEIIPISLSQQRQPQ